MFPFTKRAPQALLANLRETGDTTGVARSQRGLLENVLRPASEEEIELSQIASTAIHSAVGRYLYERLGMQTPAEIVTDTKRSELEA